jgi:hypothetical protein
LPPDRAYYSILRPGGRWEAGRNARDAHEWQLALKSAIDELIALHKEAMESCFRLAPSPLTSADEAACQKYNEASQRALEVYHTWLNERAELEARLGRFKNDMERFEYPVPDSQTGTGSAEGAGAGRPSDKGEAGHTDGGGAGSVSGRGDAEQGKGAADKKTSKPKANKKRLEESKKESDKLKSEVYAYIQEQHRSGKKPAAILDELKASKDRMEQVRKAGLKADKKLIRAALNLPRQRERDAQKRKKQDSPPT